LLFIVLISVVVLSVAVSIQLSVLRALLMLAKYQPDSCATMCLQWVKDHKNDLDSVTKAMLQDFHKQFSSRLKYLSELVIEWCAVLDGFHQARNDNDVFFTLWWCCNDNSLITSQSSRVLIYAHSCSCSMCCSFF